MMLCLPQKLARLRLKRGAETRDANAWKWPPECLFLGSHQNSQHPSVPRPQSGVGERLDHKLGRKRAAQLGAPVRLLPSSSKQSEW